MLHGRDASNISAPTQFLETAKERYAYRRFGSGPGLPLLLLQHFTGTLDNWDPAVTDPLASTREVILFDNAGIGGSTGRVPETVSEMTDHLKAFLDALEITTCDVLGYSLGGMIAQELMRQQSARVRRAILVATAPRGGEDIMHLDKPELARFFADQSLQGYARLKGLFFAPSDASQAAGEAFVERLNLRQVDRDPPSGPEVAKAQIAAFRDWERYSGSRFSDLKQISQPVFVVNGARDLMIPVRNSYYLAESLPNATLLVYPDAGHGALFQFHNSFVAQSEAFLDGDDFEASLPLHRQMSVGA
jgi:pimeloyl-ACP methyl ester carboxylesterase